MENIPQKKFNAKVIKNEDIAQGVKKITIKISEPFSYFAWQYVWVEIPEMKVHDIKGSRRAFSILNPANDENTIEVVARIGESGYKQNLFALDQGDKVVIHGPFGHSFVVEEKHQPDHIIMIAGGIGVAAFLPMIETIKKNNFRSKCYLVYLNKNEETTPFIKELKAFKKGSKFFDYKIKYEIFSWDDVRDVRLGTQGKIEWWVAGPQAMVDHVYNELEKGGVSRIDMYFDNFYPTSKFSLTREMVEKHTNNLFAKAIQNSTNHTVITDLQGKVMFANKAAERITGFSLEEILGNTPRLWGGMMSGEFYVDFWNRKQIGEPFMGEIINRRKNGDIYHAIAHIAPIFGETNDLVGYIGTEEDITERKNNEIKILSLNNRFQLATRSAKIGVWDWDVEKNIITWDDQMYALYGIKKEDFGGAYEAWQNGLHPEDKKLGDEAIQAALRGEKDFEPIFRVLWPNGEVRQIRAHAVVERDSKGKPIRMIGVNWDVTKEFEVDKEKTEFVSLVSHQLKTPVGAVKWNLEMLLSGDYGALSDKQKEIISETYTLNMRMNELINDFLNISGIEMGVFIIDPKPTDFVKLCEEVLKEMEGRRLAKGHELIKEFDEKLPIVPADAKLLRIIFQNFVSNAIKYTQDNGKIAVILRSDNENITFSVKNNGEPIPGEDQSKIFQRMYRASNAQEQDTDGNGLGLYVVKQIVERAGGKIWFTSKKGEDTVFACSFPISGMIAKRGTKQLT